MSEEREVTWVDNSVPEDFLTWNKRDKAVHVFNVLAANKNINIFHISVLISFMIKEGVSNAYVVTMSLGRLFSETNLRTVEYNDMYETLRPYILAEKGQKHE